MTGDVTCPTCGADVTCSYKCQACDKPRPFGTDGGPGRSQEGR